MAKKRARVFETKFFGPILSLAIFFFFLGVLAKLPVFPFNLISPFAEGVELKLLDLNFGLKNSRASEKLQEGVTSIKKNAMISDDILIVGIDSYSLSEIGKWPFPRYYHADLINAFARIKDQGARERALFLDTFFIDPDKNAVDDAILVSAMEESGRVYLETILTEFSTNDENQEEFWERQLKLIERSGSIMNVKGDWQELRSFLGSEPPLYPYAERVQGYGHANFREDSDKVYRRQPLVAKVSRVLDVIPVESLAKDFTLDASRHERLTWLDKNGIPHNVPTPLTDAGLAALKKELVEKSPPIIEDTDQDGVPDKTYHTVRKYRDYFIPSITLALALDYFNKKLEDIEVTLGKEILIKAPQGFDPETRTWKPYRLPLTPERVADDGTVLEPATWRELDEIRIPINENGQMRVNFMGPPSSATSEGHQTFIVRPYAGYASMAPGSDPETWRKTLAVQNKIVMVGAFAKGMAQDEKPTPFGMMYGIEIHANALNTILMNNFIFDADFWLNALILFGLVMLIGLLTSQFKGILGFVIPFIVLILLVLGYLVACSIVFESKAIVLNYTVPVLGMLTTLLTLVAYRAMTEEKDKKRIREMFGKYVSPAVVTELMQNPPELGGVDKQLTVLFSDIRGFTTLSENMSPQELVNHLNVYLTAMTDLILEYGGTLDKYVGDEVMCFWGAPMPLEDHAVLACKCAIRQMQVLHELNQGWPESRRINIGIGLNSGIMTVGNMGSPGRMNYTLMGDNVNLGARLEGTNKEYGTNIIISEFTYGLVKEKFVTRELDNIRVKGKNKPVVIYELVDCLESLDAPLKDKKS